MNRILLTAATAGLSLALHAQPDHQVPDTAALRADTARGPSFVRMGTMSDTSPAATARQRTSERPAGRAATASGRSVKRSPDGPQLNVQRALDPDYRRYWRRMNNRSTRRAPGSPPGTVPSR